MCLNLDINYLIAYFNLIFSYLISITATTEDIHLILQMSKIILKNQSEQTQRMITRNVGHYFQ